MAEKQALRSLFLLHFTKAIIENIKIEKAEKIQIRERQQQKDEFLKSKQVTTFEAIPPIQQPKPIVLLSQRVPVKMERIQTPIMKNLMQNKQIVKNMDQKANFERSMMEPKSQLDLNKIKPFISDQSVISIECPGPEKPIIINKQGIIQTTNLTLNPAEISAIIEEVSNKTRIPLISGTFKAAFDNFIITAVISEFVGTRFLIQRKMHQPSPQRMNPPMQPPRPPIFRRPSIPSVQSNQPPRFINQ